MTKREWQDRQRQEAALARYGIGPEDAAKLRRISSSLRNSFEFSCSYEESEAASAKREKREAALEATAERIVAEAWYFHAAEVLHYADPKMAEAPKVYIQTDPRGCALYVVPAETFARYPGHSLDSIYSQGIAVYS